jgi:hypothetical protein
MKVLVLLVLGLAALAQAKEIGLRRFDGYQVLSVVATTKAQFETLKELSKNDDLDFWTDPKFNGVTDIMVSPEQVSQLTLVLNTQGLKWTLKIQDVGKTIDEERELNEKARSGGSIKMEWDQYERFAVIEEFIQGLDGNGVATVSTIGQSSENRPIYQVKVSTGLGPDNKPKRAIFIDSNLHAREWIAGATGTWILNELATKPTEYADLLDEFDFYFVPMANPDGYEYSHTTDRMWRKTRSVNAGSTCRGCDPNRNWSFHFGEESTSDNPCSDLFTGPEAFSEPETQAISQAIKKIQGETTVYAYYTLHSYGQLWLLSWGYTQGVYPDDYPELLRWGTESVEALESLYGTRYEAGQGADMLYGVGGASDDWSKSEGVQYVATIELRGNSFILPPAQIVPTATETLEAIRVGILGTFKKTKQ